MPPSGAIPALAGAVDGLVTNASLIAGLGGGGGVPGQRQLALGALAVAVTFSMGSLIGGQGIR